MNDHSDLYVFGIDDLHKIFIAFETLNNYFNKDKVQKAIIDAVMEIKSFNDQHYIALLRTLHKRGLLEKYQDLYVETRVYFQHRYEQMDRETML